MIARFVQKIIITAMVGLCSINCLANTDDALIKRPEVINFIDQVVRDHNYNRDTLNDILSRVELRQDILNAIASPAEAKPWYFYRSFFVNSKQRTQGGLTFWQENADILNQAERSFGVPAQYIVAILGIETLYGKHQGKYRVLDSLATLAFAHKGREAFFRRELTEFLLMIRENQLDPTSLYGSYAGAMGQPQFMPSNYRRFAISAKDSKRVNLMQNPHDAIMSVANYLSKNGWHANQPVAFKTTVKGKKYLPAVAKSRKYLPKQTQAQLAKLNIKPVSDMPLTSKAILVELQRDKHHKEYWLGFQNFYAITRYNPSANYAMAVFQLGNKLNDLRNHKKS